MTPPLHCPKCQRPFLRHQTAPNSRVLCPHCAYHDSIEAFNPPASAAILVPVIAETEHCAQLDAPLAKKLEPTPARTPAPVFEPFLPHLIEPTPVPSSPLDEAFIGEAPNELHEETGPDEERMLFDCPHCEALISCAVAAAGVTAPCPYCEILITSPAWIPFPYGESLPEVREPEPAGPPIDASVLAELPNRGKQLLLALSCTVAISLFAASWLISSPAERDSFTEQPAEDALSRFLNATLSASSWQDLLPNLRNAEGVQTRMASYYASSPYQPFTNLRIGKAVPQSDGQKEFLVVDVRSDAGQGQLAVERKDDGYKLDWESLVNYGAIQWRDFCDRQPLDVNVPLNCTIRWGPVPNEITDESLFPDQEPLLFFEIYYDSKTPGSFYACAPQSSKVADKLLPALNAGVEHQAKLEISLHPAKSGDRRIAFVHGYIQEGWLSPAAR